MLLAYILEDRIRTSDPEQIIGTIPLMVKRPDEAWTEYQATMATKQRTHPEGAYDSHGGTHRLVLRRA